MTNVYKCPQSFPHIELRKPVSSPNQTTSGQFPLISLPEALQIHSKIHVHHLQYVLKCLLCTYRYSLRYYGFCEGTFSLNVGGGSATEAKYEFLMTRNSNNRPIEMTLSVLLERQLQQIQYMMQISPIISKV